jgi:hypothetical protein
VEPYLEKAKTDWFLARDFAEKVLPQEHWKGHPEWVEQLLNEGPVDTNLGSVDAHLVTNTLGKAHWANHPEWIETILAKNKPELNQKLVKHVFPFMSQTQRSRWIESLVRGNDHDTHLYIAMHILSDEQFKDHPEWFKALLDKNDQGIDSALIRFALTERSHWQNHPEFIETLVKRLNSKTDFVLTEMLFKRPWKDHPELLRLTGGEPPTPEDLFAAFERGESLRTEPQISCISQQLTQSLK